MGYNFHTKRGKFEPSIDNIFNFYAYGNLKTGNAISYNLIVAESVSNFCMKFINRNNEIVTLMFTSTDTNNDIVFEKTVDNMSTKEQELVLELIEVAKKHSFIECFIEYEYSSAKKICTNMRVGSCIGEAASTWRGFIRDENVGSLTPDIEQLDFFVAQTEYYIFRTILKSKPTKNFTIMDALDSSNCLIIPSDDFYESSDKRWGSVYGLPTEESFKLYDKLTHMGRDQPLFLILEGLK